MLKLLKAMLSLYHVILTMTIKKYLPHCDTYFIDMTKIQKREIARQLFNYPAGFDSRHSVPKGGHNPRHQDLLQDLKHTDCLISLLLFLCQQRHTPLTALMKLFCLESGRRQSCAGGNRAACVWNAWC